MRNFILMALIGINCVSEATELARSKNTKVTLLELFTSESCSSCPPANE